MDTVIKAMTGLFFTLLLVYIGIGLILSSLHATRANRALSEYVDLISCSNYADDVIEGCQKDAREQFGGEHALIVDKQTRAGSNHVRFATATLTYRFQIPVMGFESVHTAWAVIH